MSKQERELVVHPMTEERKARFRTASMQIVDIVTKHTMDPVEAWHLLKFVMDGLEETFGVRGAVRIDTADQPKH